MRFRGVTMVVGTCLLAGCSNTSTQETEPAPTVVPENGARTVFAPPRAELPANLPEGTVAMEVLSWGVSDGDDTLGSRIAALSRRPEGTMERSEAALRRQGLRLVRLDAADVGAIFEIAPPVGAVRRRLVLPSVRLEDVVDGTTLGAERAIGTPLGSRTVGPGTARLATRAWATVRTDGTTGIRADLIGVIGAATRTGQREILSGGAQRVLRGTPVPGLATHLDIGLDEAWLLVAASPEESWSAHADTALPAPAQTPIDPALDREPVMPVGPKVTPLRTSGETLFRDAPSGLLLDDSIRNPRLMILLVGRGPERLSLFESEPERVSQ